MSTNKSILKDPLQSLPDEMFTHTLSFLPPSGVAISSAVSREWRRLNLSAPLLHNEVDLSDPKWKLPRGYADERRKAEMDLFNSHFSRLSSLSLNRLVKVSLNLSSFVKDFVFNVYGDTEGEPLLDEVIWKLSNSTSTLKDISINLRRACPHEGGDYTWHLSCPQEDETNFILIDLLAYFDNLPNLEKIKFYVPSCIELKAGGATPGSKLFILEAGGFCHSPVREVPSSAGLFHFMKQVSAFVGSGFTDFSLMTDSDETEADWSKNSLECVFNSSRLTLKHLKIEPKDTEIPGVWKSIMSCPNLEILSRRRDRRDLPGLKFTVGSGERISLQDLEKTSSFRNVFLKTELRWIWLLKWIGNGKGLENIRLEKFVNYNWNKLVETPEAAAYLPPLSLGSILSNAQDTLKHINLDNVGSPDHEHLLPTTTFPHLESLFLKDTPEVWSQFSNLKSFKLASLIILFSESLEGKGIEKQHREVSSCFLSLLKGHASTLVKVTFRLDFYRRDPPLEHSLQLPTTSPQVSFTKLKDLFIGSPECSKWLSTQDWPALEKLDTDTGSELEFKKNAPKLQVKDEK